MEVALGDDLVEGEFTATLELAGGAVAEDVLLFGDLGGPGDLAAMAVSLIFGHGDELANGAVYGGVDVSGMLYL